MRTNLHSFMDIFSTEVKNGETSVQLQKIVIPIIQRDYAQGRRNDDIDRIRNRFLDSLYHAIVDKPITLDFIYGDIDDNGIITPLDGQQRLTTLFLLHWYAAKKENISECQYAFLNRFSYETRYSARYFCSELVRFVPSFKRKISEEIIDQSWFPLDWIKDSTIHSMLVMLDAIDTRFKDITGIWEHLKNNAITFYFLPIKDMGLTDELYIKMNSRGKPLTSFEHFKAELEREIRNLDAKTGQNITQRIMENIDKKWTDLLWLYRDRNAAHSDNNIVDDEFLRYFKFICDILCYRRGESPQSYGTDIFDLLHHYFSADDIHTPCHIQTLEAFFDCWCHIGEYDSPTEFLASFMSYEHEVGKIKVDSKNKINIFEDCLHAYSDKSGRNRQFPLNRIVLLYAITTYLQHQTDISKDDFIRRIRIVNNLIQNSEDELSDRQDRNRIPAILEAVDVIILTGRVDEGIENSFNVHQLREEKEKIDFLSVNPHLSEKLFALEDNELLQGQIGIIGCENLDCADKFVALFKCSWDKVDCALMAIGNYGQQEQNKWRFQYGSKNILSAWYALFHKSANTKIEKTKDVLLHLLSDNPIINDTVLDEISSSYIQKCEENKLYPWAYYYIKYDVFRPGSYGKLSNSDLSKPYLFSVMQTKTQWSQNTYMPYLKEVDDAHLSKDKMGQRLVYETVYITCENNAFFVYRNEDDVLVDTISVSQTTAGVDTEDRIVKLKNYINSNCK